MAGLKEPGTMGLGSEDPGILHLGPVVNPNQVESVGLGVKPGIFEPVSTSMLIKPEAEELGPGYPGPVQHRP